MSSEAYLKEQIISEARAQYGLYITQELVKDRPAKLDVIFRRYEVDEYEIVYRAWVIVYLDLEMSKWYLLKIGDCHDESRKLALENLLDTLIDQAEVKRKYMAENETSDTSVTSEDLAIFQERLACRREMGV